MNKYEQAKLELNKFVKLKTTQRPAFMDVVEEALKKQIPMPVLTAGHCFICPRCKASFSVHETGIGNGCKWCLQAIDWNAPAVMEVEE